MLLALPIGLACINLIFLFLNREINTDGFHLAKNQIYALKCDDPWSEGQQMNHTRFGSAEYMKDNLDEVEDFCRINNASPRKVIVNNESYFDQKLMIAASRNFFEFFSYNLLTNNPKTVLEAENDLVISEDLAKKYFGSGPAVGQIITLVNKR